MASDAVKQAIERLNSSTSGLSDVRVGDSSRRGDHVSAPRPEKPDTAEAPRWPTRRPSR